LVYLNALCRSTVASATLRRLAESHFEAKSDLFQTNSISDFKEKLETIDGVMRNDLKDAARKHERISQSKAALDSLANSHINLQKLACRQPACNNKRLFQTLCSKYVTNRTPAVYLPQEKHPFNPYHVDTSLADDELGLDLQAVLQPSTSMPEGTATIRGWDFNDGVDLTGIMNSMLRTGCQASALGQACNEVNRMVSPLLQESSTH